MLLKNPMGRNRRDITIGVCWSLDGQAYNGAGRLSQLSSNWRQASSISSVAAGMSPSLTDQLDNLLDPLEHHTHMQPAAADAVSISVCHCTCRQLRLLLVLGVVLRLLILLNFLDVFLNVSV